MEDAESLEQELKASAEKMEKETGEFPTTISYPNGSYSNAVMEASEKIGYKLGLAVKQRFYDSSKDSLFDISRVEIYNESWFKTKLRITGKLEVVKNLLGR